MELSDDRYKFILDAKGLGFLASGAGFYAPVSVALLLQYLVERRLLDQEYLRALGMVAVQCGKSFLAGDLTVTSQRDVALAAGIGASRVLVEDDAPQGGDQVAYDAGVVALITQNGERLTADRWLDVFAERGHSLKFREFADGMKLAIHVVVVSESRRLSQQHAGRMPQNEEDSFSDIGAWVMDGYVVGRFLLGTQESDLSGLARNDNAKASARALIEESEKVPHGLVLQGGDGLKSFLQAYLRAPESLGVLARVGPDRERPALLLSIMARGFNLAVAEHVTLRS